MSTERLPSLLPTPEQAAYQELEMGMFVHFGLYAVTGRFTGITWCPEGVNPLYTNTLEVVDPGIFNPVDFDADQWVETALAGGARYLILTAKHHEGFCLWPTKASPYRAQGDLVGEVAAACRAAGLRFGFYLSPWDVYAWQVLKLSDAEYDEFYEQQLTELLTGYGEITEIWWDGAGSKHRRHDWRSYYRLVKTLQPGAVIMGAGCSDVRWVWEMPEEQGLGLDPNWHVVHIPEKAPGEVERPGGLSLWPPDQPAGDYWWPAESYLAMDRFWSGETGLTFAEHLGKDTAHTAEEVVEAWHRTVGYGLNLVVNFVPRPGGDLPPSEVESFAQAGERLKRMYAEDLAGGAAVTAGAGWWQVDLGDEVEFDRVVLREEVTRGQSIDGFRVLAGDGKGWKEVCAGGTVGRQRIAVFAPVRASRVRAKFRTTGEPGRLRSVGVYLAPEAKV